MLEGQVAALSAGTFTPDVAVTVLESLFASDIYRHGQDSFMLYPDRQLPGFLEKNRIPAGRAEEIPLLRKLLDAGDNRLVYRDADGWCRFRAGLKNAGHLRARLDMLSEDWPTEVATDRQAIADLYEEVFRHRAFTGRSGTMFGYEGLGSIYWHMVSKLLLAVQENFFAALQADGNEATLQRLGELYYRVRQGLGFNKSPAAYGAFPTDPYSHTPKHNGASQPGMTGQVKEEVLSRFGELGIRVTGGAVTFAPRLLRRSEFLPESRQFSFFALDETWRQLTLPSSSLGFTWCQVPVVYQLDDSTPPSVDVTWSDGTETRVEGLTLPADVSTELFLRSNRVRQLTVSFGSEQIFAE